ncbi:MAG: MogA/MoaB family molybdenum cofactor biosynthesis protein [Fimbriimonas sp.]|nr:MogA/MoaB family molybdenum cofactor biosynthesis protein [Fimbriimonas sp.]
MAARIGILTVSDTRTPETDVSGATARETLHELGFRDFETRIVPDEVDAIQSAILELCHNCHAVFTTGGTGFAPRDVTPEATAPLLEKRADSLCELMRLKGMGQTSFSHLSRGIAGICRGALVVNLPGSPKAVLQGIRAIAPLIGPIIENLNEGHCPVTEC